MLERATNELDVIAIGAVRRRVGVAIAPKESGAPCVGLVVPRETINVINVVARHRGAELGPGIEARRIVVGNDCLLAGAPCAAREIENVVAAVIIIIGVVAVGRVGVVFPRVAINHPGKGAISVLIVRRVGLEGRSRECVEAGRPILAAVGVEAPIEAALDRDALSVAVSGDDVFVRIAPQEHPILTAAADRDVGLHKNPSVLTGKPSTAIRKLVISTARAPSGAVREAAVQAVEAEVLAATTPADRKEPALAVVGVAEVFGIAADPHRRTRESAVVEPNIDLAGEVEEIGPRVHRRNGSTALQALGVGGSYGEGLPIDVISRVGVEIIDRIWIARGLRPNGRCARPAGVVRSTRQDPGNGEASHEDRVCPTVVFLEGNVISGNACPIKVEVADFRGLKDRVSHEIDDVRAVIAARERQELRRRLPPCRVGETV